MIFRLEAVPESIVRRYFLQVPALLNLRFPGSHMPICSTDVPMIQHFTERSNRIMRRLNARLSRSNDHISVHRSKVSPPTAPRGVPSMPGVPGVGGGHPRGPPVGAERRGRWTDHVGAFGSLHRQGHHRELLGVISTVMLMATAGRQILIGNSALLASSSILPRPQPSTAARIKPRMAKRRRSRASGGWSCWQGVT